MRHSSVAFVELIGKTCQPRRERVVPRAMEKETQMGEYSVRSKGERVGAESEGILTRLAMWTLYS